MISNFFQKRFEKNIKFLARKDSLQQDYEFLYEGLELQEIFLTEIAIIKKLLLNEKTTKRDLIAQNEFDSYIKAIEEFYEQVESMDESELARNEERIKMIIAAAKLSLNSPTYFNVDINRLQIYNIDSELTQFLRRKPLVQSSDISILIEFKQEIEREIEKKQRIIEHSQADMTPSEEKLEKLETIYWSLYDKDLLHFLQGILNTDLNNSEKKKIVQLVTAAMQEQTPENIEKINNEMSILASVHRREISYIKSKILRYEQQISILKRLAQNITEDGQLKEFISDELIEEYIKQFQYSKLDKLQLQLQILKEQARIIKKQRIEHNTRLVEQRIKKLTAKVERKVKTKEEQQEEKKPLSLTEEQKKKIDFARSIVTSELGESSLNEDMILDELEEMFVEELKKESLDEQTIEQVIKKDANSNLCSLKFIVYGLNYQLENLNLQNIEKSLKLISIYIKYYCEYNALVEDEKKIKQEQGKNIDAIEQNAQEIINSCQIEMFDTLTEEQKQNLNAYIDVDIDQNDETVIEATKVGLSNVGLDLEFLSMYKSYKLLNDTISETKFLLEMMREDYKEEYKELITQKLESIKELFKQFNKSKQIYDEKKNSDIISEDEEEKSENIIIYFETSEGTTQAEERILEDSKMYGKHTQTDISNIRDTIKSLKTKAPDDLMFFSDSLDKLFDTTGYKVRKIRQGKFRLAFLRLNSSALKTEKPVYLVVLIGKKPNDKMEIYDFIGGLKGKVIDYERKLYKFFENATPEERQEFLQRQHQHEENIMKAAQNERGELDATRRR